jgi:hypothetical protein
MIDCLASSSTTLFFLNIIIHNYPFFEHPRPQLKLAVYLAAVDPVLME